jgi:hypothetical protein
MNQILHFFRAANSEALRATVNTRFDSRTVRVGLSAQQSNLSAHQERIVVLAIFAFAALLRGYGIWGPLPFYTVDEANFVWPAVFLPDHHFNPYASGAGWFGHPGHFLMYILSASYSVYFFLGKLFGYFPNFDSFKTIFLYQPMSFYVIGRVESVIYGLVTILGAYMIAKKCFGSRAALLAALFLAVSPLHTELSQIVRTDTLMICLVTRAFLCCVWVWQTSALWAYVLTGVCIGLGVATKYPAAVAMVPLVFAHVAAAGSNEPLFKKLFDKKLWCGFASAGLALAVSAPFVLLNFKRTVALFRMQAEHSDISSVNGAPWQNYWWYLTSGLSDAHGIIIQLFVFAGVIVLLRRRRQTDFFLLSFPVAFLLGIGLLKGGFVQWILPIIPLTSIFAAIGFVWILENANGKWPGAATKFILPIVALLAIAGPTARILAHDVRNVQKHYSLLANEWVEQHIPAGSVIALEEYAPPVSTQKYLVLTAPGIKNLQQIPAQRNSETNIHGRTWRYALGNVQEFSTLTEHGVQYAIVSLTNYGWFQRDPVKYRQEIEFYETLFRSGELLYEIPSNTGEEGSVRIYKLKPS